jgi:sporulation protein YlmC with PRC-barrel domain
MRLSDLRNKRIETIEGKTIGRVHEVHCDRGRVVALISGAGSLIERWTARRAGRPIPWEAVRRIDRDAIIVKVEG